MKIQIVAALLIIAYLSTIEAKEDAHIYCGRILAEAMAQICDYGEDKRSGRSDIEYFGRIGWFGPRTYHASSKLKGKRGDPGITEVCCEQPCNIATLMEYC